MTRDSCYAPGTVAPKTAVRGLIFVSLAATASLVGTLGGWSALTSITSAVVAQGRVVIEGDIKRLQHRDGGVVEAILVANGDSVTAGQILLQLENTDIAANLAVVRDRLAAALALQARLTAEQAGATSIPLPPNVPADIAPALRTELAAQTNILTARTSVAADNQARLAETLSQLDREDRGLTAQIAALHDEIDFIDAEIAVAAPLFERQLTSRDHLSQLHLTQAQRRGTLAALQSTQDTLQNRRRDAALQNSQTDSARSEEVAIARQQIIAEIAQLKVERANLEQKLDRVAVRAPVGGVVHELQVTTIGGVVAPGAGILDIVPGNRAAAVEVRVPPGQIEQIHPGQAAELMVSGTGPQAKTKVPGTVRTVSAAAVPDPQTGRDFFRVTVAVDMQVFDTLGVTPVPGLPVEVFLTTGTHSVLSYLIDPVTTHLQRAFRE